MSTTMTPETMAQPEKPKSRTGCILLGLGGGCLVLVLACAGLGSLGVFGVFAAMKSSEPYTESLQRAEQDAALKAAIGQPVTPGFLMQGNINLNNDDGEADLSYSVSGPEGSASVHVVATKIDGFWTYALMNATTDDGDVIDLIAGEVAEEVAAEQEEIGPGE